MDPFAVRRSELSIMRLNVTFIKTSNRFKIHYFSFASLLSRTQYVLLITDIKNDSFLCVKFSLFL